MYGANSMKKSVVLNAQFYPKIRWSICTGIGWSIWLVFPASFLITIFERNLKNFLIISLSGHLTISLYFFLFKYDLIKSLIYIQFTTKKYKISMILVTVVLTAFNAEFSSYWIKSILQCLIRKIFISKNGTLYYKYPI
jgi:hypothetical protein